MFLLMLNPATASQPIMMCVVTDAWYRWIKRRHAGTQCSDISAGRLCNSNGRRAIADVSAQYRRPRTQSPHSQQVMTMIKPAI